MRAENMTPRSPRPEGHSLAEVLVATLVLSVSLAPLLFLFPTGARKTAFGVAQLQAHLRARALVAHGVDAAIRARFQSLPEGVPVAVGPLIHPGEEVLYQQVPGYPGLWRVTARVEWVSPTDQKRRPRIYELTRLIHRPDVGLTGDWSLVQP